MSDREILDIYVDLEKSCLSYSEKKQVMDMLYKYNNTFSLRDQIGTCQNIEAEIDVTDKSLFFIRPHHVRVLYKAVWELLLSLGEIMVNVYLFLFHT